MTLTVVIEGWRFLPHSYALVNQSLCLEFLKRPDVRLFHRDMPPFSPDWTPERGLISADDEARIAAIPPPPEDLVPDALFRVVFPYDLSPPPARRTFVQITAELGMMPEMCMADKRPLGPAHARSNAVIVTPSAYCRDGLRAAGADPARIAVVPHGVDPAVFAPAPAAERESIRRQLGWDNRFVFMNVGAMTENKGLNVLLLAFAMVAAREPGAILLLKGVDSLYQSAQNVGAMLARVGLRDPSITSRIVYHGASIGRHDLAQLYRAADAYVSPYLAEGFNIPVLEAAACGLPVICTANGPTDEFTTPDFALRIRAAKGPSPWGVGVSLTPDPSHTAELMGRMMADTRFRARAAETGPAHVRAHFTWPHAARRMIEMFAAA